MAARSVELARDRACPESATVSVPTRRPFRTTAALWGAATLLVTACSSLSSYRFGPSPQSQELRVEGRSAPFARAHVSSLGISKGADGKLEMCFRFRLRNPSEEPLFLRIDAFELVDAALQSFGPARLAPIPPATDLEVAPGTIALFDVVFPFPDGAGLGDMHLDGLSLEWGVRTPERDYTASLYFARLVRVYAYDPWYSYYVGVGYTFG